MKRARLVGQELRLRWDDGVYLQARLTKPRKAPVVLSQEEVARLLQAAPSLKYKAALSVAYGAGLRVSEVANLKVSDIDSGRMMLRVEQGKQTNQPVARSVQHMPRMPANARQLNSQNPLLL